MSRRAELTLRICIAFIIEPSFHLFGFVCDFHNVCGVGAHNNNNRTNNKNRSTVGSIEDEL